MPRRITWGTPGRSKHYLNPRRAYVLVVPAVALAFAAPILLLALHAAGLRTPVSPGDLISPHASVESRCHECHAVRSGASNFRCQRCHDPSGAGRLANSAHVLFGSRDLKKAGAAPNLPCAQCHVEHRGRRAPLDRVDQAHCLQCHFRSFSGHPEFAVLRNPTTETPGLKFGHQRHVEEVIKQSGGTPREACLRCHEPASPPKGRDIDLVSFDRHCASCHAKEGSVGVVDPVSQEDALPPAQIAALGVKGDWVLRTGEYETARGKISKPAVRHRDPWVLWNLNRLRREVEPAAYEAERGALLARLSQLRRRLVLAAPLASLDENGLAAREAALDLEIKGLEARIGAQAGAGTVVAGLGRVQEVAAAASSAGEASGQTEAARLRGEAEALTTAASAAQPSALSLEDFEERRRELLATIDAVEAADGDLKPRAEDLRRRLLALSPGEVGRDALVRVRDQRLLERNRVRDEVGVRRDGTTPPAPALLLAQERLVKDAIQQIQARLDEISSGPPPRSLSGDALQARRESLEVLAAPCVKCHELTGGALARVVAARPVLVRARFVHQPHLQVEGDCFRCHAGVDTSKLSKDLNFKGVASCRECHRGASVRQDCQTCHRYHPPSVS
jgi:hypothetical protein